MPPETASLTELFAEQEPNPLTGEYYCLDCKGYRTFVPSYAEEVVECKHCGKAIRPAGERR